MVLTTKVNSYCANGTKKLHDKKTTVKGEVTPSRSESGLLEVATHESLKII